MVSRPRIYSLYSIVVLALLLVAYAAPIVEAVTAPNGQVYGFKQTINLVNGTYNVLDLESLVKAGYVKSDLSDIYVEGVNQSLIYRNGTMLVINATLLDVPNVTVWYGNELATAITYPPGDLPSTYFNYQGDILGGDTYNLTKTGLVLIDRRGIINSALTVHASDVWEVNTTSKALVLANTSYTSLTDTFYPGDILNATTSFALLKRVYYTVSGTVNVARNAEVKVSSTGINVLDKGYYYTWVGDINGSLAFVANESGIFLVSGAGLSSAVLLYDDFDSLPVNGSTWYYRFQEDGATVTSPSTDMTWEIYTDANGETWLHMECVDSDAAPGDKITLWSVQSFTAPATLYARVRTVGSGSYAHITRSGLSVARYEYFYGPWISTFQVQFVTSAGTVAIRSLSSTWDVVADIKIVIQPSWVALYENGTLVANVTGDFTSSFTVFFQVDEVLQSPAGLYIDYVKLVSSAVTVNVTCPPGSSVYIYDSSGKVVASGSDSDLDGFVQLELPGPIADAKLVVQKPDRDYMLVDVDPLSRVIIYNASNNVLLANTSDNDGDGVVTFDLGYEGYQDLTFDVTYGGDWKLHVYVGDWRLWVDGTNVTSNVVGGWYNVSWGEPKQATLEAFPTADVEFLFPNGSITINGVRYGSSPATVTVSAPTATLSVAWAPSDDVKVISKEFLVFDARVKDVNGNLLATASTTTGEATLTLPSSTVYPLSGTVEAYAGMKIHAAEPSLATQVNPFYWIWALWEDNGTAINLTKTPIAVELSPLEGTPITIQLTHQGVHVALEGTLKLATITGNNQYRRLVVNKRLANITFYLVGEPEEYLVKVRDLTGDYVSNSYVECYKVVNGKQVLVWSDYLDAELKCLAYMQHGGNYYFKVVNEETNKSYAVGWIVVATSPITLVIRALNAVAEPILSTVEIALQLFNATLSGHVKDYAGRLTGFTVQVFDVNGTLLASLPVTGSDVSFDVLLPYNASKVIVRLLLNFTDGSTYKVVRYVTLSAAYTLFEWIPSEYRPGLAMFLIIAVGLVFSAKYRELAGLAMVLMAGFLWLIGLLSLQDTIVIWIAGIVVVFWWLTKGRRVGELE